VSGSSPRPLSLAGATYLVTENQPPTDLADFLCARGCRFWADEPSIDEHPR